MRERLLELTACPRCRTGFRLCPVEGRGGEVTTAILECGGGHLYPVVRGIPRLYPGALRWTFAGEGALDRLPVQLRDRVREAQAEPDGWHPDIAATQRSFSSEWSVMAPTDRAWGLDVAARRRMFLDCFAIDEAALAGRKVLDVGCGHGEVELSLEDSGAEVVAMDLSSAIDDLRRRLDGQSADWPQRLHLVQGSVDRLPFADAAFDFVHSAGVLHHTPDTRAAFERLAAAVRPGGSCYIEVYSAERKNPLAHALVRAARVATVRMPHPVLHALCFAAAPLAWTFTRAWNAAAGEDVYRRRTVREMELSLFDGFSPRHAAHHTTQEVIGWFAGAGFESMRKTFVNKNGFGILGVRREGPNRQAP